MTHYAIAIATGLTPKQAALYAQSKEKESIHHLRVVK